MIYGRFCNYPTGVSLFHSIKYQSKYDLYRYLSSVSNCVVKLTQCHSNRIEVLDFFPQSRRTLYSIHSADAVISNQSQLSLVVKTADCLPILMWHPKGWMAAIHAGRKGTEQHILARCLAVFIQCIQTVQNISLWFGPAICRSCYEINSELSLHYDLIFENMQQLKAMVDLSVTSLYFSTQCTVCSDRFHSYRKHQKTACRNLSSIRLLS